MGNLEHECRQGHRCKARHRDTAGKWHGKGVERGGTLCRACEDHAFAAIRHLDDDYDLLYEARLEERSHVSGPKVSGSSERPIPIQLGIDTLMTDIIEECTRWANRLPGEGGDIVLICTQLGTLVDLPPQRVTVWRPHPDGGDDTTDVILDGVDAVLRLAHLHHRTQSVLGLIETTAWLNESCHVCGYRMLTMALEHELIQCRNCKNCWHQDEFARLNNPLAVA